MKYCEMCDSNFEKKIITKNEIFKVFDDEIEVETQVLTCGNCGSDIYDENLDNKTLLKVYNEYRKKHKLLLPDEIKNIRETYGLSQTSFSKLLNWKDKTIQRYERGAIQDKIHNSLLLFLKKPENMKMFIEQNEINLDEEQLTILNKKIDELIDNNKEFNLYDYFLKVPSIENGFKCFDYEKIKGMVLFFANKNKNLLKTKLMKLLNYSDMIFYKENSISMSGLSYLHYPFGPVPENFDILIGLLVKDKIINVNVEYNSNYESHQIIPNFYNYNKYINDDKELEVLERVYIKFKNFTSSQISDYSHEEKGYFSTKKDEIISFEYARYIDLDR